jgi:AAA lid domain-containing protein
LSGPPLVSRLMFHGKSVNFIYLFFIADEYRKTIGKDAALERRFQPITIDEPTVASTISILRGLKPRYEVHHGVEIADGALVTGLPCYSFLVSTYR